MSVPDFQTIMLPLLQQTADGKNHTFQQLLGPLATALKLSDADRSELLPSGRQKRFDNRVYWAGIYLTRAALLERPERGVVRITQAGLRVLAEKPSRVDIKYLGRFPAFSKWRNQTPSETEATSASGDVAGGSPPAETPEEQIDHCHRELNEALAEDLLVRLKGKSPTFFEHVVLKLMEALGYGGPWATAFQHTGKPGDGGIDGLVTEDKLGLETICLQAKRYDEGPVAGSEVQKFAGSLDGKKARKGVFITTSTFSASAVEFAKNIEKRIVLIDGERLAGLMIEHGVGVRLVKSYEVKKVDPDFFDDE